MNNVYMAIFDFKDKVFEICIHCTILKIKNFIVITKSLFLRFLKKKKKQINIRRHQIILSLKFRV